MHVEQPAIVIFRVWPRGRTYDATVIALFPNIPFGTWGRCMSYAHIGQHGEADYQHVISLTKRATPTEYAELHAELESLGYRLVVRQRRPPRSK